MNKSDEEVI